MKDVDTKVRPDLALQSLTDVLEQADSRLQAGSHAAARVWPTGFDLLDRNLGGGVRSGELILLAGPQGLGKTTWALQAARNIALAGRSVLFFSFEHDPQTMLIRLVALEAGLVAGVEAPDLARIRSAFEASDGHRGTVAERLASTQGGAAAIATVADERRKVRIGTMATPLLPTPSWRDQSTSSRPSSRCPMRSRLVRR